MKTFLLRTFTWWNSQTFGTQVWTRLYGEFVGDDEFGNRYYRTRNGKIDPTLGFERRWVIYRGIADRPVNMRNAARKGRTARRKYPGGLADASCPASKPCSRRSPWGGAPAPTSTRLGAGRPPCR